MRMEIEYSYNSKTKASESAFEPSLGLGVSDKVEMGIQTAFINAYYDFETGTMFTPYIGGGVGLAFIDAKGSMNFNVGGYEVG